MLDNEDVYINDLGCSEQSYPHLDLLFNFLTLDAGDQSKTNLTAAYYFYQIANSLINKEQVRVLSYVYSQRQFLKLLISRTDVSAYKQLLSRIVHFYKDDEKHDFAFKFLKYRFTLLSKIFNELLCERETGNSSLQVDPAIAKERNLLELLSELLQNKDKILDAEYFIELIFLDKKNLKRLMKICIVRKSAEILRFLGLLLTELFGVSKKYRINKSELDTDALRHLARDQCEEEEILLELPDLIINRHKPTEFAPSQNPPASRNYALEERQHTNPKHDTDDTPTIFVTMDLLKDKLDSKNEDLEVDENELAKEQQNTAETSNGIANNIELDLYDGSELKREKIGRVAVGLIEALVSQLFDEQTTSQRAISISGISSTGPVGPFKISILRFLGVVAGLQVIEDRLHTFVTSELITKLLALFERNPLNNVLHFELAKVLENVFGFIFEMPPSDARQSIIEFCVDKLNELSLNFRGKLTKPERDHHLYKSYVLQLATTLESKFQAKGFQTDFSESWTHLLDFLVSENKILKNKAFLPFKRPFLFSSEILPETFELNNSKINKIIDRKQKHMPIDDELLEINNAEYTSNHPDLNMELLDDLIYNLDHENDFKSEDEDVREVMMDYEVTLDIGSPKRDTPNHRNNHHDIAIPSAQDHFSDMPLLGDSDISLDVSDHNDPQN